MARIEDAAKCVLLVRQAAGSWAIWPKENAPGFDLSPFHAQSGSEYLLFFGCSLCLMA
jgi:hypothetical protein